MQIIKSVFLLLVVLISVNAKATTIVDPVDFQSSDTTTGAWLVYDSVVGGGVELKINAVAGWPPTSGIIQATRLDGVGGTATIFHNGFENASVPVINGGLMDSTWWRLVTGQGPAFYLTDRVIIGVLPQGRYQIEVDFVGTGVQYASARFMFTIP